MVFHRVWVVFLDGKCGVDTTACKEFGSTSFEVRACPTRVPSPITSLSLNATPKSGSPEATRTNPTLVRKRVRAVVRIPSGKRVLSFPSGVKVLKLGQYKWIYAGTLTGVHKTRLADVVKRVTKYLHVTLGPEIPFFSAS